MTEAIQEGEAVVLPDADPTGRPTAVYCGHCGEESGGGTGHEQCRAKLELEPPRYCPECRRRLIVQVLPTGFVARCSAHGELV